jgi:heme/copper-type cytochrome/quinol oxidase subunit 2
MSGAAIFSMIVIVGLVLGGFVYFLLKAIRKENKS